VQTDLGILMQRVLLAAVILFVMPVLVMGQVTGTGVTAEAIGQANLRANPDVESALVGEILAGTQYPVIGRSAQFPWLLLGDPVSLNPIGWVFDQLVTITGDVNQAPLSTLEVSVVLLPPPSASLASNPDASATIINPTMTPSPAFSVF
jgi:hypothetical protein